MHAQAANARAATAVFSSNVQTHICSTRIRRCTDVNTHTSAHTHPFQNAGGKVPGPLAGQVHKGWLRSLDETWAEVETVSVKSAMPFCFQYLL